MLRIVILFLKKMRFKKWKNYYQNIILEENGFIDENREIKLMITIYLTNAKEFMKSMLLVNKG